jgi:hypothetical protein
MRRGVADAPHACAEVSVRQLSWRPDSYQTPAMASTGDVPLDDRNIAQLQPKVEHMAATQYVALAPTYEVRFVQSDLYLRCIVRIRCAPVRHGHALHAPAGS